MSETPTHETPWLRSVGWDSFWMLSGLWLLIPVLGFAAAPMLLKMLLIGGTLLLWLSHRFAATYNAFCLPAYRELIHAQRRRFLVLPCIIIVTTFSFVYMPASLVSLDIWGKTQVLATIFFVYNAYHFGVQHYGVLSIYRIRVRQNHVGWLKRYEKTFCLAVGTVAVALGQMSHGAEVIHDAIVYQLIPYDAFTSAFGVLRVVMPALVLVLAVIFYMGEFRSNAVSWPKVFYVAGVTLQGVLAYWLEPMSFLLLWGVQHWLVSVALGAHMAENDRSTVPDGSVWYSFWQRFTTGFWPSVFVLALISVACTPFFEFAVHPEKISWAPDMFSVVASVLHHSWLAKFFIALNFASVYVHFVMDRAIFRFSDPAVRKISVPLLFAVAKA